MGIQVNDFRWDPGMNDAEYIKLLESSRDEWERIAQKAISKLKILSKAQESIKPLIANDMYFCGSCKYAIPRTTNYCPKCGKKVKWDG